jgi:hypothetical protein
MANLIRSAKPGSDWTQCDLDAYNVHVIVQDAAAFFGIPFLPEPQVPAEILSTQEADDLMGSKHAGLVDLLDVAMLPPVNASEESAVVDFAVELFRLVGYVGGRRCARTRMDLPLPICGETKHAKTDVCIINYFRNQILLVVQEDKHYAVLGGTFSDTEAQLIAEAIAAFVYNNEMRRINGLPELQEKVLFSFHKLVHTFLATSPGHAWNHYGRDYPDILQNSHHPGPCRQPSSRTISRSAH